MQDRIEAVKFLAWAEGSRRGLVAKQCDWLEQTAATLFQRGREVDEVLKEVREYAERLKGE